MENAEGVIDGDESGRSEAGQVVDALGNTGLFAYRVVALTRLDGTCVLYRGAYEVGPKSDTNLGFVEKCTGPTLEAVTERSLRWEPAERSRETLAQASQFGYTIVAEGTFVFRRDVTADELARHLDSLNALGPLK
jgi:hypothetical protein